jgi:hypothetical protein
MQFEAASDWHLTQGTAKSLTVTSVHTQGQSALAVTAPSGYVRIDSKALSSTNPQLASIGLGSKVSLDFLLPALQANPYWFGAVQMYITAPSRNVYNAYLGQIELTPVRTGLYTTLHFSIPDAAATALKGATYTDLTFGIVINVPTNSQGVYLLDNLRLKGAKLPARPTNATQIQPGQSILLEASKTYAPPANNVAAQTFTAGVVQIPQSFHVLAGAAGTGSATFEYKIGTAAPVVCRYPASGATSYVFASCANGTRAGDLVPADFVRLTVVNGDPTAGKTKIKAQIALNPVGDELPAGLPPIPTFFGTTGADIRDALDAFVQAQRNWQIDSAEVVHLPTPAIPVGFPVTTNGVVTSTPPVANDPPFSRSSRLTGSDMADAGWHVTGSIAAPVDAAGNRDTHFDVDVGADAWLLTLNVNDVIGFSGSVDTHTPAFDGQTVPPSTGQANFCYRYLGFSQACKQFQGTAGINEPIVHISPTITFFSLDYWVFHVGSSANLSIDADLSAGFTPNGGFTVAFDPKLNLAVELEGGVSLGVFAGGGVFANVTLIGIDAPFTASVNTSLNSDPRVCSIQATESMSATATISSGGGSIGYYIEGGLCCGCFVDVCWRDDGDLFSWSGSSTSFDIVPASPLGTQSFPLPTAVCTPTGGPDGGLTYPITNEAFNPGDVSFIKAAFSRTFVNTTSGVDFNFPSFFDCSEFAWSSSDPSDVLSALPNAPTSNGPCYTQIKYGNSGLRTLTATATDPALGNGLGSVTVFVLTGDPTTAPAVTILTPAAFANNNGSCGGGPTNGTATDPNGLDVSLDWFFGDYPVLFFAGSGASVSPPDSATLVRLMGTNSVGQSAINELPISFTCVKG